MPDRIKEGGDMVLVPREPTPEMYRAGAMAIVDRGVVDFGRNDCVTMSTQLNKDEAVRVFQAMIKAALANQPGETT